MLSPESLIYNKQTMLCDLMIVLFVLQVQEAEEVLLQLENGVHNLTRHGHEGEPLSGSPSIYLAR